MKTPHWLAWLIVPAAAAALAPSSLAPACCPAGRPGQLVVNADQTVVMVWNPETRIQHFIRQASFKTDGDDVGFIVPTPSQPALEESGNEAFAQLADFTKPEVEYQSRPREAPGCGCALKSDMVATKATVRVLEEKLVAGFNAVVLEATDAGELVNWLNEHGYEFSPEVKAWAEPYVKNGWKFTALKVADKPAENTADSPAADTSKTVSAAALRITFQTERPLFPYREPDMTAHAKELKAHNRLLRIFFLSNERYAGELTKEQPWTGTVAWSGQLKEAQCETLRASLNLPDDEPKTQWWLTEFEDYWPYVPAPADLYFAGSADQSTIKRAPRIIFTSTRGPMDAMPLAIIVALVMPVVVLRLRRRA